jgi:hypothetical protein
MLLKKLQELFLTCFHLSDDFKCLSEHQNKLDEPETQQQLKHLLKSYALLSEHRQAEQLFIDAIVKPYMQQVIFHF